jgi:sec-independent protein translocase protein TatC
MPKILRPIGHEDRLSVIDHLDELRSRLISAGIFVVVVFGICFWQNHVLLDIVNKPLNQVSIHGDALSGVSRVQVDERSALQRVARDVAGLSGVKALPHDARVYFSRMTDDLNLVVKTLPRHTLHDKPITIGVGEPFTTTVMVVLYFSLLLSLPVLLYQLYAFVIPALSPKEQKVARPVMLVAPGLFITGVVFTYFLVLPPAVKFLQGYNSAEFNSLVQAAPYYKFELLTMLGIGLAFQVPLILAALHRAGVVTGSTLTGNWRYGILVISIVVAILPGVDPVTMAFEGLPLVLLYLASIVLLKIMDRRDAARARREQAGAIVPDRPLGE